MTDPDDYAPTAEALRGMLTASANNGGSLTLRAAVHLLTFTELPAWRGFRNLVDLDRVPADTPGAELLFGAHYVARVRDWHALPYDTRAAPLSATHRRLIALAVSLAVGQPVDLRDTLPGLGHAHARRVLEAVAIATDAGHYYTLTPTPALAELEARRAELTGGAL